MYKTVLKSVLYSLICCIFAAVISLGLACLIAPLKTADFVLQLNMGRFATVLTEAEYKRDGNINTLALTVERAVTYDMHSQASKYGDILIGENDYADFCKFKDSLIGAGFSYDDFIMSGYVYATYKTSGGGAELFAIASSQVDKTPGEYRVNNAVSRYVDAATEDGDLSDVSFVAEYLEEKFEELSGVESSVIRAVCLDGYRLSDKLNDANAKAMWLARYNAA